MLFDDTIAAVSTPKGKGGIAVIRISGGESSTVLSKVFRPVSGRDVTDYPERHAIYGIIKSPSGDEIDMGVAVMYRAPASYTGEDMAELSCHGGVYVTRAVLSAVLEAGARHAGPGEFTKRAFLAGKLTLTEAEAVGAVLDADTEERMKLASSAVRGRLSDEISKLSKRLSSVMSALYAAIDYPEEDIGDEGEREIGSVLMDTADGLKRLLATYKQGKAIADGVRCVICGMPNSGKSSLFNLITGEEDAIVTEIAGTTRDVLRASVSFGGITLNLSDTAGLRKTDDEVERIGVSRAEKEIKAAELIISVFDSSRGLSEDEIIMIEEYPPCPRIAVLNKSDLDFKMTDNELKIISDRHSATIKMSCISGIGMDELSGSVGELYSSGDVDIGTDAVIWDARQEASLRRAVTLLNEAAEGLKDGEFTDAVCTLCENALSELSGMDGRGVTQEIVDGIFSRFCVGK